ncbi:hypothetical protein M413DRAFT_447323 [Hebeloma cylindrosporum]|uniref:Uncharacterized protein n=1 Tax=Hebeloma cylindrosporum TaxID=76867 RepID=A0A0C3BQN0_HEBCY|nr:hypothetical protein M413DRAFT_447323 [Hebeloma cylindrosporum h7]
MGSINLALKMRMSEDFTTSDQPHLWVQHVRVVLVVAGHPMVVCGRVADCISCAVLLQPIVDPERLRWELATLVDMVSKMMLQAVDDCRGSKRGRGGFRE